MNSPMIQRQVTNYRRLRAIRRLEEKRHSRVITLIHRQEAVALLGLPITRYIDASTRRNSSSWPRPSLGRTSEAASTACLGCGRSASAKVVSAR
jgi:Serine dehydrogenase proteinase